MLRVSKLRYGAIVKVIVALLIICVVCVSAIKEAKAEYYCEIIEHGDGRNYDKYEVTTTQNDKVHKIDGTRVYHSHKQASTTITVKKGYSHTKKRTSDTGVGMSKGIIKVEQKWGFSEAKTFKYESSVAFKLDRKTQEGYYSAGMIFPGVKVVETKKQCVRTGNTLPFENGIKSKDKEYLKKENIIKYVPNQDAAKKLIVD